jgi:hypothetical protein
MGEDSCRMTFDSKCYIGSLPADERQLLREQMKHSVSCYGLNGEHFKNAFDKENLLAVLLRMERYMPDSNSLNSIAQAEKSENRNKAFIIGQTVTDEADNLEALLFSRNVGISNKNLFEFGHVGPKVSQLPARFLIINRLDPYYRITFDAKRLRVESRERAKRTDADFLERKHERMANVRDLKQRILDEVLGLPHILPLPSFQFVEQTKSRLIETIRENAPNCFKN